MNPAQQYARAKTLFQQARELPTPQRAAWVSEAAQGDAALVGEVMSLLAQDFTDGAADEFLAPPVTLRTTAAGDEVAGESRYRMLAELGSGGMGMVYLAERIEAGFCQRVAIKFATHAALNREHMARFRAERQFLARLVHPNIARLLDGGTRGDGVPFLVMEYVEGAPIDQWCTRQRLGTRERVGVFVKVCRAVQVAHQNLIVHRDLKPANILVDPQGEPRLLDFGIAKLLDEAGVNDITQAQTRDGAQLMTPRYASPEQLAAQPVTTAADIYSLGVVLYELVTGVSPYGVAVRSAQGLARAVCETAPMRPSAVAGTALADATESGAGFRVLSRDLRGDIDAILLKCLRKQPQDRYPSAAALADDLERYLQGRPVQAHSGSAWYRTRTFIRRNRLAVATAGAFVALLVGGLVALSVQLERTRIERDKAERVTQFLLELFRQADPTRSRGETITVREVLDRGARRLDTDTQLPAATRAAMQATVGSAFHQLGLYAPAESLLSQSAEAQSAQAPGSVQHIDTLGHLAALRLDQGQLVPARELAEQAAQLVQAAPDADAALQGRIHYRLGLVRLRQGDLAGARGPLEQSLADYSRANLAGSSEMAESYNALANWHRDAGDPRRAEEAFGHALAIYRAGGADRWAEARSLNNLALLRLDQSDIEGAERLMRDALPPLRAAVGDEHPLVAAAVGNLAGLLNRRGDFDGADSLFAEALALRRKLHGDEHPGTALTLANRGYNDYSRGRFEAAETAMRQALAVQRKVQGEGHASTLATLRNLAAVRLARGAIDEALALYRQTIADGTKALSADHPFVWTSRTRLAQWNALGGDDAPSALAELQGILPLQAKKLGDRHVEVAETRMATGLALLRLGKQAEGCAQVGRAQADWAGQVTPTHPDLLLGAYFVALCGLPSGAQSSPALVAARQALVARYGADHPLLARLPEPAT
ncbi:protein kinase domain-containing protein [Tahibacter amnicola]|uniref:Tetratricopeptide repeat protein n=1 Tax=Tahibacter amnicola TaxID=2976241 RepID=A0ABY6BGI4_9GAMM|nr:tetratricopeptide repeat protein [Tahibacter amnicola]UXI66972.1 tetratricopeptide repeat protein [Tahibacter amnicola]